MHEHTKKCLEEEQGKLKSTPSEESWRALSHTIFVLVTVFNKRRGGEVSRIRVKAFEDREGSDMGGVNKDLMETMSNLEQQLVKR